MASSTFGILPTLKFSSIYHINHKASNNYEPTVLITTKNLSRPRFLCLAGFVDLHSDDRLVGEYLDSCDPRAANPPDNGMEMEANKKEKMSVPNSLQVQALVSEICSTSIAEFELKIHGFRLFIARDISGNSKSSLPVAAPDVSFRKSAAESLDSNGAAATSTALAISNPELPLRSIRRLVEKAADEGLIVLKSPKVISEGLGLLKENEHLQPVKRNKLSRMVKLFALWSSLVVKFQLNQVAGEITKILKEDGEPVGYGDPLIVILPSFPGIKKLQ